MGKWGNGGIRKWGEGENEGIWNLGIWEWGLQDWEMRALEEWRIAGLGV